MKPGRRCAVAHEQPGRRPPGDSLPLQTIPAPPGAPQVRRTLAVWCRPEGRRRLRGGRWPSLPPLGGLLPLHPQTPLRYARHCMAAYAAAAHPATAGQHSRPVPRSRLCGGCSPWPPCRPPVPVSRRARTRPGGRRGAAGECCGGAPASQGGTRLAALFRPPVPLPAAAAAVALRDARTGPRREKNKCTKQKTGAGKVHRFTRNILCTLPLPPPQ